MINGATKVPDCEYRAVVRTEASEEISSFVLEIL